MVRMYIALLICLLYWEICFSQAIPLGLSKDSIYITELSSQYDNQSFYLYKPINYNANSPLWFVIHGTGGSGAGTINNLQTIADRRGALMIGLTMDGPGTTMISQTSLIHNYDSVSQCVYRYPGTLIMNKVYQYICNREGRTNIPTYLSGFSAGGQFVSRYLLIRQAYPDSIPLKMSLSMSPIGYTLPTDSFLGTAQPWVCGLIMPTPVATFCPNAFNIYSWNCNEHIVQFYNENYAVCVGNQDLASQINGGCYDVTGVSRLDRARTFYAFCDSNAISRGTTLNWQYAEIPAVGHDEFALFNAKYQPTDSFTIAESLLFDTPYQPVIFASPVAMFSSDTTIISANDTIFFTNSSLNASTYNWDFGDSTSSIQTNPYHIYTQSGLFNVELTAWNSNGCDSWHQSRHYIQVTSGVGFQDLFEHNLSVYPNPSSGKFEVRNLEAAFSQYIIYDFNGRRIQSGSLEDQYEIKIELKNSAPGLYLISLIQLSGKAIGIKHLRQ